MAPRNDGKGSLASLIGAGSTQALDSSLAAGLLREATDSGSGTRSTRTSTGDSEVLTLGYATVTSVVSGGDATSNPLASTSLTLPVGVYVVVAAARGAYTVPSGAYDVDSFIAQTKISYTAAGSFPAVTINTATLAVGADGFTGQNADCSATTVVWLREEGDVTAEMAALVTFVGATWTGRLYLSAVKVADAFSNIS